MARFYANENFPQPVIEKLRRLGHEALTVLETGHAGQSWSDENVLRFATAENRILLTMNRRHFRRLHAKNPQHAGIVLYTVDLDFVGQAKRIDAIVEKTGDCKNQILSVNRPSLKPR
jgi:uncharacterized protein with PIN domain